MSAVNYLRARSVRVAGLVLLVFFFVVLLAYQRPTTVQPSSWMNGGSSAKTNTGSLTGLPEVQKDDPFKSDISKEKPEEKEPAVVPEPQEEPAPPPEIKVEGQDRRCAAHPDPGNIAIAVKTGATEAVEKIPNVMLTTMRCAKNVMIFSDLAQNIAGYEIHDALRDVPETAMKDNDDWNFYKKLKDAKKYGQIVDIMKDSRNSAWTMDKYKQLHALEYLYEEYPDKDWYIMIDADSYLIWPNALEWLSKLPNPRQNKLYLGSPAMVGEQKFAHGGSGIFISHAAMSELVGTKGIAAKWDIPMKNECCGDYVIALALKDIGVDILSSWPTVNGEKPVTLPFGPSHWCQPVVTMHHAGANEINQIANFELWRMSQNNTNDPLTFSELYHYFTKDILPDHFDDWYNESKDDKSEVSSFEECRQACEQDDRCFQFSLHDRECKRGHSIHLGTVKWPENGVPYKSGWLRDRIKAWVDKQEPCKDIKWPHASS